MKNKMKVYMIIGIIVLVVLIGIIGFFSFKDQNNFESEGTIVYPASPVHIDGLGCGPGFRINGSYHTEDYEKLGLTGNYITLCSNNLGDWQFQENKTVKVEGKLYKSEDGRGYVIVNSIEDIE